MTTSNLKKESTVTGDEYKGLREVEQKMEDLAIEEHRKEEDEKSRLGDENQNSKERDQSVNTEETDAQRRARMIRLHLLLLEHASYCNSSKCHSNCAKRKQELEHISSCREGFEGGCIHCTEMLNLIRIHAMSCETSNCKVPRCELVKERLRKMRSEQSVNDNPKPAAATAAPTTLATANIKKNSTVTELLELGLGFTELLEHASICNSSKCSSSCATMKEFLEHSASGCRQKECKICVRIFGLTRIHALKCKTKNCKIPRCDFHKRHTTDNPTLPLSSVAKTMVEQAVSKVKFTQVAALGPKLELQVYKKNIPKQETSIQSVTKQPRKQWKN